MQVASLCRRLLYAGDQGLVRLEDSMSSCDGCIADICISGW